MDFTDRYVYVFGCFFQAFRCAISRQEFFWRYGPEPFSRQFFLDGGASSSSFNYTVNITWTVAWLNYSAIFPECVARVPMSNWWVGAEGVFARRCVCAPNRCNCSQPSATVRNRPQPSATVRVRTVWPCLF